MSITAIWNAIQIVLSVIGGGLAWFFGKASGMLYALVALTVIDYLMGLLRHALIEHNLSSRKLFTRGIQKLVLFVVVGVAHIIDEQVLKQGPVLRNVVIFFYLSSEGVSILEHAAAMGLPIPDKLLTALQELHADDPLRDTSVLDAKKKNPASAKEGDGS